MPLPTIDLSSLMSCSLPMQCDGITWQQSPMVTGDVGKVAVMVSARVEGFISCPDQATLATAIAAINTNGQTSGSDFKIVGPGAVVIHQLLASECYEGGPHVAFEILDDGGGYRRVRATVSAKAHRAKTLHTFRRRLSVKPNGLVDVEQVGTIVEDVPGTLFPSILADFTTSFPYSRYVISYEDSVPTGLQIPQQGPTTAISDQTCTYRISAIQLASALPTGGTVTVVDGEASIRKDRDEQQRVTTAAEFRLELKVTGSGDYTSLVTALRPTSGQITHESVRFSNIHGWKLDCSFTALSSNDGDQLLQFSQTIKCSTNDQTYEVYTYPGASPIAVPKPTTFPRVTQSGSLTGLGAFLNAPSPLLPSFATEPSVTYTDVSNYEKRTEWEYSFLDTTGFALASLPTLLAAIARPAPRPPGS